MVNIKGMETMVTVTIQEMGLMETIMQAVTAVVDMTAVGDMVLGVVESNNVLPPDFPNLALDVKF
jgi:hypothetical protein